MRTPLPIDAILPDAMATLRDAGVIVVTAPPGSGKTTRLPAAMVDAGVEGEVVVLEPRRLAARAAARRVAFERGGSVGDEVGYQVRHETRASRATRLRFVTEGILVRRLCADPFLEPVGAVVLDEFHERHVETDLALAMLREVRETVRDDLRVVVMSATLDAGPIAAFLGGCPIVAAEGTLFPVDVRHLERPLPPREPPVHAVRVAVGRALAETTGDALVFLPGVAEIRNAQRAIADVAARAGADVLPLHGALPAEEQDRAIRRGERRRIVLSTNVAESSVTIEGVTAVVDTGLARVLRHDPARGLDALRVERISLASATQRAGRAGRTGPGACYRLWTTAEERGMAAHETPEIRRADLAGPALIVRTFAAREPAEFSWFEAPEPQALLAADALLRRLGAVDARGGVTPAGRTMLRMPLHPRLARAMVEAERLGCPRGVAQAAALLAERDPFRRGGPDEPGPVLDLAERVACLHEIERSGFRAEACSSLGVDRGGARSIARARDQIAGRSKDRGGAGDDAVARALLAGFVDRVVRRREPGASDGTMVGGRGVRWQAGALHTDAMLLLALDVADSGDRRTGTRSNLRLAVAIEREWLDGLVDGEPRAEVTADFDEAAGRAVAVRRTTFLGLVLDESRGGEADPQAVADALAAKLREDPWRWLGEQRELQDLVARVRWLRERRPGLGLPALDDAAVADAAASLLPGLRTLRDLRRAPVASTALATWSGEHRRALAEGAPERVALPSGRNARIDYASGPEPFLAARLQEFFGARRTPTVAGEPLLLHLLAPNHRPVQVTRDLASFWENVYPRVRSELRRRYPKHSWPEDPTTAAAESRPKRRRRG